MAEYFKNIPLKQKNGEILTNVKETLKGKLVAIYFSAHWCGPCRDFTPELKKFYNEIVREEQNFEIIFVSGDKTDKDLQNYLNEEHGNWLYVPFGDENIKKLEGNFKIDGIPYLVIINENGQPILNEDGTTYDGVEDIQDTDKNESAKSIINKWKKNLPE